jgi:hypothetical protein
MHAEWCALVTLASFEKHEGHFGCRKRVTREGAKHALHCPGSHPRQPLYAAKASLLVNVGLVDKETLPMGVVVLPLALDELGPCPDGLLVEAVLCTLGTMHHICFSLLDAKSNGGSALVPVHVLRHTSRPILADVLQVRC